MMKDAKILIVEDDDDIVEISTTALSESYELIEASDGREAFNLFKQHKPGFSDYRHLHAAQRWS